MFATNVLWFSLTIHWKKKNSINNSKKIIKTDQCNNFKQEIEKYESTFSIFRSGRLKVSSIQDVFKNDCHYLQIGLGGVDLEQNSYKTEW